MYSEFYAKDTHRDLCELSAIAKSAALFFTGDPGHKHQPSEVPCEHEHEHDHAPDRTHFSEKTDAGGHACKMQKTGKTGKPGKRGKRVKSENFLDTRFLQIENREFSVNCLIVSRAFWMSLNNTQSSSPLYFEPLHIKRYTLHS